MNPLDRAINSARERTAGRRQTTARLDDMLEGLMGGRVTSSHERFAALSEAWERLLPPNLAEYCEIKDFTSDGRLKVRVASPAHRYELQLCTSELLTQLKRQCPTARVRRIELAPA